MSVFGSYVTADGRLSEEQEKQLLQSKRVGNTLYIMLGNTPRHLLFEQSRNSLDVTVAAPADVKVIVRDSYGNVVTR